MSKISSILLLCSLVGEDCSTRLVVWGLGDWEQVVLGGTVTGLGGGH